MNKSSIFCAVIFSVLMSCKSGPQVEHWQFESDKMILVLEEGGKAHYAFPLAGNNFDLEIDTSTKLSWKAKIHPEKFPIAGDRMYQITKMGVFKTLRRINKNDKW